MKNNGIKRQKITVFTSFYFNKVKKDSDKSFLVLAMNANHFRQMINVFVLYWLINEVSLNQKKFKKLQPNSKYSKNKYASKYPFK